MFTIDCVTFVYLIVEIIYIVKCACMNSIIVGMGGATLFLLLPIVVCPKPYTLVLIEGHYQHFKAKNNSSCKCKNGLCEIYCS